MNVIATILRQLLAGPADWRFTIQAHHLEQAAAKIERLEAVVGGGDTAIRYLEMENLHLRDDLCFVADALAEEKEQRPELACYCDPVQGHVCLECRTAKALEVAARWDEGKTSELVEKEIERLEADHADPS